MKQLKRRQLVIPFILCTALLGLFSLSQTSPAYAGGITVNTSNDFANNEGECTLRDAIAAAGTNTAVGYCPAGGSDDVITFSFAGPATINLGSALPDLSGNITINGPGADQFFIRRNTEHAFRIFTLAPQAKVTLPGVTISNGPAGVAG